jgi:hypothetical protein
MHKNDFHCTIVLAYETSGRSSDSGWLPIEHIRLIEHTGDNCNVASNIDVNVGESGRA